MNAPIGAALLIGLGALFLLDNLGVHVFEHISKFWPVLLIVIGLILLQRRVAKGPTSMPPPGSNLPSPPKGGGPSNIPGPLGM